MQVSGHEVKPLSKVIKNPFVSDMAFDLNAQRPPAPSENLAEADSEEKANSVRAFSLGFSRQRGILVIGDLLLISLASFLSVWIRFGRPLNVLDIYTTAFIFTLLLYPIGLYIFDLYNMGRSFRSRETLLRSIMAVLLGAFTSGLLFYLVPTGQYGRGILAIQMVLVWVLVTGWRQVYGAVFQAAVPKIPTLILGAGDCGKTIYQLLMSPLSLYDVRGFLDDDPVKQGQVVGSPAVIGTIDQLGQVVCRTGAKAAILAISKNLPPKLIRSVLETRLDGIEIHGMPDLYERITGRIPVRHIEDQWLLLAKGFYLLSKEYMQKIKRLIDICVSGLLLLCTASLMALISLAIMVDSPGSIFYRQMRIGKGGRVFTIYKFRSMHQDAEAQGARWAEEGDPRVTRVGRWLRLSHMDEIPQLWNVFKGDISLVGPRPERPEFVGELEAKIPYYFVRHSVQPGITGWAQVNYRYGSSVEDAMHKLEYDLYYIKNMSILLDLKILLRTIGVVFLGEGAR